MPNLVALRQRVWAQIEVYWVPALYKYAPIPHRLHVEFDRCWSNGMTVRMKISHWKKYGNLSSCPAFYGQSRSSELTIRIDVPVNRHQGLSINVSY